MTSDFQRNPDDTPPAAEFEAFYRESFEQVARAVSSLVGSREEALDVTQEAFTRAWENWYRVGSYDRPVYFVLRVAYNFVKSRRRSALRRLRMVRQPAPSDPLKIWESTQAVRSAIKGLPGRQRAVIVLCDVLDLDSDAAAAILGIAPSTVRVHLSRARSSARQQLRRQGEMEG